MKTRICCLAIAMLFSNLGKTVAQLKTIKVGNQIWMAENLDVNVPGSWVYNGNEQLGAKHGRLYTWDAAKNACPDGWHLPSDDEWNQLANTFGGEDIAGKQLKINGSSGFNAPLAGYADGHTFWFINVYGGYWSSTGYDDTHAWYRFFTNKADAITKTYFSKNYGFSVRCVKN